MLTALEYFHEKAWIDLKPKSAVEVFEVLDLELDIEATARKIAGLFVEKEKKDIVRLHDMIKLFEADQCLAKSLSGYFGERLDSNCGKCSVCLDKKPIRLESSKLLSLDQMDFHSLLHPLADVAKQTMPIDLVTRFLCGVTSPRLAEYKARQLPGFASLEAYP